jgi:small neutral amino acid transporter SnatA (MarC family)
MTENKDLIVAIFSILGGTFCIVSSIFNWDFFFDNRKATFFVSVFGRNGARIFYGILGLFLYFLSFKMLTK